MQTATLCPSSFLAIVPGGSTWVWVAVVAVFAALAGIVLLTERGEPHERATTQQWRVRGAIGAFVAVLIIFVADWLIDLVS